MAASLAAPLLAQDEYDEEAIRQFIATDSIHGQTGAVPFKEAHCTLDVPEGFVFLNPVDSRHLLVDYWDNPEEKIDGILGTMVTADAAVFGDVETAYVISYDSSGYVSDEDAGSIDYDELLESIQESMLDDNKANPEAPQWELLGWAWNPTYDNERKVLGWAKHFRIDGEYEVVNYDVRVLGKAGFVVITAIASPDSQAELMANNAAIIGSVRYDAGYNYADFNPATDHVAEWTIGGLVAGKILTKVGFWGIIAKFSKIIIIALIGFFAAMRKRIASLFGFGRKKDDEDNGTECVETE